MRISARMSLLLGSLVIANTLALAHEGESRRPGGWSFGQPGLAKDVTRTIRIEADEYSFDPAEIAVKVGETVTFVVVNNGKLMHELTIGDAAEQEAHQQAMSKMSDMKHDEGAQKMPANSLHIPPGQTRELTWMFSKNGRLIIACNYPGHSVPFAKAARTDNARASSGTAPSCQSTRRIEHGTEVVKREMPSTKIIVITGSCAKLICRRGFAQDAAREDQCLVRRPF